MPENYAERAAELTDLEDAARTELSEKHYRLARKLMTEAAIGWRMLAVAYAGTELDDQCPGLWLHFRLDRATADTILLMEALACQPRDLARLRRALD